jgi:hypothetical protein
MPSKKSLAPTQAKQLLATLKSRFETHPQRHSGLTWPPIEQKLQAAPEKLWSLNEMEKSGGEPDVVAHDKPTNEFTFYDCAVESPKGRRSLCFDRAAWNSRKEAKPKNNAIDVATAMGATLLTESQYRELQQLQPIDTKTSSWIATPAKIRALGGALFCDRRFDTVFTYHNGAESYYAARAFRCSLRV